MVERSHGKAEVIVRFCLGAPAIIYILIIKCYNFSMLIAKVCVDIQSKSLDPIYDYLVPQFFSFLQKGFRVLVPFGKTDRIRQGIVLDVLDLDNHLATKSVHSVLDQTPTINEESFLIISYLDSINVSPLYSCIKTSIPNELTYSYSKSYRKISSSIYDYYFNKKGILKLEFIKTAKELVRLGIAKEEYIIKQKKEPTMQKFYVLNPFFHEKFYSTYPQINDLAMSTEYPLEYLHSLELSDSNIKTLVKNNVMQIIIREKEYDSFKDIQKENKKIVLNDEQKLVYQTIKEYLGTCHTFLLNGVTGSGKTEVYLKLINDVIEQGKNILVLTPEITLVTPLVVRIMGQFSDCIVFHSLVSKGERLQNWTKVKNQMTRIIIGTRSSIFLPLANIGLIIIDEEHDKSYLQDSNVSYFTHDIVDIRSKYHSCPVVFGSATPRIISYYKALNNEYTLLELKHKAVQSDINQTIIVNMTEPQNLGKILSPLLIYEILKSIEKKHSIILMHTLKGSFKYYYCHKCGFVHMCPNCTVTLTHYKTSNTLRCHYCGHFQTFYELCPNCLNKLDSKSYGIDSVYEELTKIFPRAKIMQADTNVITTKSQYEKIYLDFKTEEYDILLGTQMIAKGLDFPNVDLCAIINADYIINTPSYDNYEQAYILMKQFSGRSGRFLKGKCIIQTSNIQNISIKSLMKNYDDYYYEALSLRKISLFPPYKSVSQLVFISSNLQDLFSIVKEFMKILRQNKNINVIGPNMALIPMLNSEMRVIITIKSHSLNNIIISNLKILILEYQKKYKKLKIRFYPFY